MSPLLVLCYYLYSWSSFANLIDSAGNDDSRLLLCGTQDCSRLVRSILDVKQNDLQNGCIKLNHSTVDCDQALLRVLIELDPTNEVYRAGSSIRLRCNFELIAPAPNLRFNLRWSRDAQAGVNQSEVKRGIDYGIHTWNQPSGLDLVIESAKENDTGDYFCQAFSNESSSLFGQASVHLAIKHDEIELAVQQNETNHHYDPRKLLPGLQVIPEFSQATIGERLQLMCTTNEVQEIDNSKQISWSFSKLPSDQRERLLRDQPHFEPELAPNTSTFGNVLVIWSISEQHFGLYKCSYRMTNLSDLQVEAFAEVVQRANIEDMAPTVHVSPAWVRVFLNQSTEIRCEASGQPAPLLSWYRVDRAPFEREIDEEGISSESISHRDTFAYCQENKCHSKQVSAISLLAVNSAQASNEGQFACRASNKHGSNQASSVVDVDTREPPSLSINGTDTLVQVVTLNSDGGASATFKCTLEAGKPNGPLRWLRKVSNGHSTSYDLSQMSSATSGVSIVSEENGRWLTLSMMISSLDDEGDYVCLASNEWGQASVLGRLRLIRPLEVKIAQPSPYLATPGQSFQLDCNIAAYPPATDIEWSQIGRGILFSRVESSKLASEQRALLKFDRVTGQESGEYACSARDHLNSSLLVRDTIMLVVESPSTVLESSIGTIHQYQLPQLITKPASVNTKPGSNITIDCLAVSGLQPVVVEWLPPQDVSQQLVVDHISQFGSRLKITNITQALRGVYLCKGMNRLGVENAPALVSVSQEHDLDQVEPDLRLTREEANTKLAKAGANIELKCQVSGIEQLATTWSRDGHKLPSSSVQIGHNLWIRNVSSLDNGLYICSARASKPSDLIQARVNLLVQPDKTLARHNLRAKIVSSRNTFTLGDSITLECNIIAKQNQQTGDQFSQNQLDELEKNVIWTNLHSGQSLFQDNVYIRENLVIIYELRPENSATYRCNYNELTQHVDFELRVANDPPKNPMGQLKAELDTSSTDRPTIRQVPYGSSLSLECRIDEVHAEVAWRRRDDERDMANPLVFSSISFSDADLYNCLSSNNTIISRIVVQVYKRGASFTQTPVSFVTLPSISVADQRFRIELKFRPEHEHGLILFSGQTLTANRTAVADYISLGLNKAYLEFNYDLGDGNNTLKSAFPVALDQWHRVIIERYRRGAIMKLDNQEPSSSSSPGKFFDLNLSDTVVFVGGHERFLWSNKTRFLSYSRGFQGCISHLRIGRQDPITLGQNRSVQVGVTECRHSECNPADCHPPGGVCQQDWFKESGEDFRCICMPGFDGDRCKLLFSSTSKVSLAVTSTSCNLSDKVCSSEGTINCQPLTSTSHKCHCKLGFSGDTCADKVEFTIETAVSFSSSSHIHLRLNESNAALMANYQDISFKLRTNTSKGLILLTCSQLNESSSQIYFNKKSPKQASKSMFVNRLSTLSPNVYDFLAIALNDGHIELSFELGSGPAIIRSSERFNDDREHQVRVIRRDRSASLVVDQVLRKKDSSPGRLSSLNWPSDIYLGGLPSLNGLQDKRDMDFVGCLSDLELNSLPPLNLIKSDQISHVVTSRNLAPMCSLIKRRMESAISRPQPPPDMDDSDEA